MLEDQLLVAIGRSPDDVTPRLVYADWLEQRGKLARANLLRLQCELDPQLVPALDDLAARLAATKRQRAAAEAPQEYTAAYTQFAFALGFARLGRPDRARALVAQATTELAGVRSDPVHGVLIDAFAARVEQRITGRSDDVPLPEPVVARFDALDHREHYAANRMFETLRAFAPVVGSAITVYAEARSGVARATTALAGTLAVEDDARLASRIDELLHATGDATMQAGVVAGCLEHMRWLTELDALPLFRRAVALAADAPDLLARALTTAAWFGWEDVDALVVSVRRCLASRVAPPLAARVLGAALRPLIRLGRDGDVIALIYDVERANPDAPATDPHRLVVAMAMLCLGDPRGEAMLDGAIPAPNTVPWARMLGTLHALAIGCSYAPVATAIELVSSVAAMFENITDRFGTNRYFCLSVVGFAEALVAGLADHAAP
jgi:uncharacterized protein (TIGR02996 family)